MITILLKCTTEFESKKTKFSDAKTERIRIRTSRSVSDAGTTVEVLSLGN